MVRGVECAGAQTGTTSLPCTRCCHGQIGSYLVLSRIGLVSKKVASNADIW